MKESIDSRFPETLKFLEEMVGIGSHSPDPEGVNKVGNLLAARFERLGFTSKRVPCKDTRCGKHLLLQTLGLV